jgi:hypothetical protein
MRVAQVFGPESPHAAIHHRKDELLMNGIGRQTRAGSRRWGVAAALVLAVGLGGCDTFDKLLEVDLPAAVTSDAVDNPSVAPILVNAVMAQFECGYSSFIMDAAGQEDNFQMVTGVAGNYSQYTSIPGGGACDGDAYSQEWLDPFLIARAQGASNHGQMLGWGSDPELIGTNAFYVAAILDVFGEHWCEFAIDAGPLLTPDNTLDSAEAWANIALAGPDFDVVTTAGTQMTSIHTAAYGLRARIRWSRGDLALAAADAAMVPDGFVAWVLREDGEVRRNMVSTSQSGGGGIQAAGFLQGPVQTDDGTRDYWISELGSHPNGTAWTSPLRFTGYLDLGIISATGAALNAAGFPVLETDAGAEDDTRVTHIIGNTAGGLDNIPQKYPNQSDDMPLVNWREMRLIEAENAGATAAGIAFVNRVRADPFEGATAALPDIQGAYATALVGDADAYEDMLLEETRRALFEEGRFWARKIIHNDKLWFPRSVGDLVNAGASYTFGGGVRQVMEGSEFQINPNLADAGGLALRGTGCDPFEAPSDA